ncbi:protein obstructor-E [Diachasma alloeum]|uniref:protein obstructor-E n=1 Tax=Diachasma alloeum TaxID=454923 RepID=UPI0007384E57|nr:protein obstructor-E [Diachasma alloeum]
MAHIVKISLLVVAIFIATTCNGQFQRQRQTFHQNSQSRQFVQPNQRQFGQHNQIEHNGRQSSASCPEKTGRFPVASQCDAYIECIEGVGEQKLCPEGLMFNPEAKFNYPCGYPIDVNCDGRPNLQPPQPTEDCPHQYGYFKIGDRQNCGQFMNCADGKGYTFDCPEGLAFNPVSYRCDWPDQVPDCDAEAFLGFTCPQGENDGFSVETRFFRSPNDCQRYFVCVEGRPRLQNCGEGNAFSELINACDAAENVTGCEPPFRREDHQTGPQRVNQHSRARFF